VLVAVFAISAIRNVHMGALAFVAALLVGVLLVGEPLDDVLGGFPVDALLILLGITYLIGDRVALIPWAMWIVGTLVACLGTSHAAFTIVPIAMSLAHKHRIHSTMMGLVMSSAIVGGALAPTSIVGITVMTVANTAGIPYNPALMFALSVGVNALVVLVAFFLFGGRELIARGRAAKQNAADGGSLGNGGGAGSTGSSTVLTETAPVKLTGYGALTLVAIPVLVVLFFTLTLNDVDLNLGAVALTLAVLLAFINPKVGKEALGKVDWNTILLLGGIITYVGVLTRLGAIDQLGEFARSVDEPLIAAFVMCVIAALVSAFASTIGIIGALVPLAVPLLIPGGGLEMTGFLYALAISASLVDCAPFGTTGATIVASTHESDRPMVYRHLTIWGLTMVVVGPVITLALFVVPFLWA